MGIVLLGGLAFAPRLLAKHSLSCLLHNCVLAQSFSQTTASHASELRSRTRLLAKHTLPRFRIAFSHKASRKTQRTMLQNCVLAQSFSQNNALSASEWRFAQGFSNSRALPALKFFCKNLGDKILVIFLVILCQIGTFFGLRRILFSSFPLESVLPASKWSSHPGLSHNRASAAS